MIPVERLRRASSQLRAYHPKLAKAVSAIAARVAGATQKLSSSLRQKINGDLSRHGLDGNIRFRSVGEGLAKIGAVLSQYGIEWDDTMNSHLFMGNEGRRTIDIAFTNQEDSFSPTPISNSMVALSWYRTETDKYEVTAYLS
jgi:hypothetical protein